MKTQIVLFSLALAMPAFAQNVSSAVQDSTSAAMNAGNNQTVILPAGNPYSFTSGMVRQDLNTNQAHSAGSSFATPAVWRCSTSGWGVGAQGVGAGLTIAGKGGESMICGADFRIAVDTAIDKLKGEAKTIAIRIACTDDVLADSYEGTSKQCPDMRNAKETRQARWDRERQEKSSRAEAILNDSPVALAPVQLLP